MDTQQTVGGASLLALDESARFNAGIGGRVPEDQKFELIHQQFEAQVERTPQAIAVIFEGKSVDVRATESKGKRGRARAYAPRHKARRSCCAVRRSKS